MIPYYYNELPAMPSEEGLIALGAIILCILGVALLLALVAWILRSMSLQMIARRRGIRNAWLAWVPLGGRWILGSLSDQYQHLVQGRIKSNRKLLLILSLASLLLGTTETVFTLVQNLADESQQMVATWTLAGMIPAMLRWGVSVGCLVFYHICNYDLYRSCNPKNAVVFLVLGILLPICEPFFYLACRKKDWGMVVPQAEMPQANPEF